MKKPSVLQRVLLEGGALGLGQASCAKLPRVEKPQEGVGVV